MKCHLCAGVGFTHASCPKCGALPIGISQAEFNAAAMEIYKEHGPGYFASELVYDRVRAMRLRARPLPPPVRPMPPPVAPRILPPPVRP